VIAYPIEDDGPKSDPERPRYMVRQTMKRNVAPTDVKRLFAGFEIILNCMLFFRHLFEASLKRRFYEQVTSHICCIHH
jgi:hypothetical protein